MKRKHRLHAESRGFTLVEAIIVLVVLAIAAMGIATLSGKIFNSQADNKTLQVGMQLMQACAEHILVKRRTIVVDPATFNYATWAPNCTDLPDPSALGFNRPTASSAAYSGAACPTSLGVICKQVTITVSPIGGNDLNPITLLLVLP